MVLTRLILPLALALGVHHGLGSNAQAVVEQASALTSLQIDLWPEFDQPSVLVILAGQVPPASAYPIEVTVYIPATSGGPHAVALVDETGSLVVAPYTTAPAGDQLAVTMQLNQPNFHVEYYDSALQIEGSARTYQFEWTALGPVTSATARIQQPVGADALQADRTLTSAGSGDFGLDYYTVSLGALTAGQTVALHLSYTKPTAALSADTVGGNTGVIQAAPPAATSTLPVSGLALGLGAVGVLGVVAAGYWLLRQGQATPAARPARRNRGRRSAARPPRTPRPAEARAAFCTQCGEPRTEGDKFCRNCGAKFRG